MVEEKKMREIQTFIEEQDIKFIRLQFCDLRGNSKNIAISKDEMERAMTYGVNFDASSVAGYLGENQSDLILHPDLSTMEILPWRPQHGKVARLLCDVAHPDGELFAGDSRGILKNQLAVAKAAGYEFNVGAECEFYLFRLGEDGEPTLNQVDEAGYFDLAPIDRGENTRREIILNLEALGFETESSHHESGRGQHEIDFRYKDALKSADNMLTFKMVVKTIAQRNGLHASFMPKPLGDQPGNGLHTNLSLIHGEENIFADEELSDEARAFIAGILAHAPALTAVTNPIVNSYKRLMGGHEAPSTISWAYSNRSALVRIPAVTEDYRRIELRSPDPACNPYLAFALILAAGMEGIEQGMILPAPLGAGTSAPPILPTNLGDAMRAFAADPLIEKVLGEETAQAYMALKRAEWDDYMREVHSWEIERYFKSL